MGGGEAALAPILAPLNGAREEQWRNLYNSVNAMSFGFVATAILISMFLVMAIFERLMSTRSTQSRENTRTDLEAHNGKLDYPFPKMTVYAKGVSVLMPGEEIPTFIAHPAPAPCPPERMSLPLHQHNSLSFCPASSLGEYPVSEIDGAPGA
ncbi:hypothetical protein ACJW30_06G107500 [Castanea mollissima]